MVCTLIATILNACSLSVMLVYEIFYILSKVPQPETQAAKNERIFVS